MKIKLDRYYPFLILALGIMAVSGCESAPDELSALNGIPGIGIPVAQDFADLIPGPSIDGTWKTGCIDSWRHENEKQVVTLTFQGRHISRRADVYTAADCSGTAQTQVESGKFRYASKTPQGAYEMEYRFDMPGGNYTQYENTRLDAQTLFISDEVGGDAEPSIEATGTGEPAPSPSTQPSSGPAPSPSSLPIAVGNHVATYGDTAHYSAVLSRSPQTETYTNQGFDSNAGTWTVYYDIEGASPAMGYDYYNSVWTSAQTQSKLSGCVAAGGSLQTIGVPAGTFETCLIDDGQTKTWYGDVPIYGVVQQIYDDGSYRNQLQSYSWADSSASRR